MGSEVWAAYLTHMHLVCLLDFWKIVCVSNYPLVIAYVILDLDCMKSENIKHTWTLIRGMSSMWWWRLHMYVLVFTLWMTMSQVRGTMIVSLRAPTLLRACFGIIIGPWASGGPMRRFFRVLITARTKLLAVLWWRWSYYILKKGAWWCPDQWLEVLFLPMPPVV